jgi:DNA polymerase, archaea type
LYDVMAPSFFYYTQTIPMNFEAVINRASGSQLNSLLIRSYIQNGESIPKASQPRPMGGGISYGVPGIYHNVWKVDVASLYPSIIRQYKLFNKIKDPNGYFLYIADKLTEDRLKNKELGKTDKYYKDLEQSQKIIINSLYGLTNAPGLNFNDPKIGSFVTATGRDIITSSCVWSTGKTPSEWGWEDEITKDEGNEDEDE